MNHVEMSVKLFLIKYCFPFYELKCLPQVIYMYHTQMAHFRRFYTDNWIRTYFDFFSFTIVNKNENHWCMLFIMTMVQCMKQVNVNWYAFSDYIISQHFFSHNRNVQLSFQVWLYLVLNMIKSNIKVTLPFPTLLK